MTKEDREQIAILASRFTESTNGMMNLAEAIELAIDAEMARQWAGQLRKQRKEKKPCGNAGSTKES